MSTMTYAGIAAAYGAKSRRADAAPRATIEE
jgi:hypothetical protein